MTTVHVKKTKSYGRYIDSLLKEARLNSGKIEVTAIGNEIASIPHSSKLLSKILKPSDLKCVLPGNIKYIENQIGQCIFNVNLPSYYFQFSQYKGLTTISQKKPSP